MIGLFIAIISLLCLAIAFSAEFANWAKEDPQYDDSSLQHVA